MTAQVAPTGLLGWVAQYGQYIAFFVQVLYWMVLAAVSVYAVMLWKRFVDNACGIQPKVRAPRTESDAVSVEEFTD